MLVEFFLLTNCCLFMSLLYFRCSRGSFKCVLLHSTWILPFVCVCVCALCHTDKFASPCSTIFRYSVTNASRVYVERSLWMKWWNGNSPSLRDFPSLHWLCVLPVTCLACWTGSVLIINQEVFLNSLLLHNNPVGRCLPSDRNCSLVKSSLQSILLPCVWNHNILDLWTFQPPKNFTEKILEIAKDAC